ncbi:MAG: hypothetical protein Q7V56_00240 [Gammaproteobacteria bacterium]|nr:hypothetical protein [Gammaproteobacteria bacterium]
MPGFLLLGMLLALLPMFSQSEELAPFTSDGCSAFPDGSLEQRQLWLSCCVAHDVAYWQGGTYEERMAADLGLQQCVAQVGDSRIAAIMLAGVRVGGTPYLPTPFRWGYGWPYPRGYKKLTAEELEQVQGMRP